MRMHKVNSVSLPVVRDGNISRYYNIRSSSRLGRGFEERNYDKQPIGFASYSARVPDHLIIPRSEWSDRIKEQQKEGKHLFRVKWDNDLPTLHQSRTKYCWGQCVINTLHTLREYHGYDFIYFSTASVCAPIARYVNRGGWPVKAVEYIAQHGVAPKSLWPPNAIDKKYARAAAKERQKYKFTEWYDIRPNSFEEVASLLLRNVPIAAGFNWWGHAIELLTLVEWAPNQFGVVIDNSHGDRFGVRGKVILDEKMGTPQGGSAPSETLWVPQT